MRHSRAQQLFSAALDGELAPRLRRRLDRHLATCPACRREFELLALVPRLLARQRAERTAADFTERLVDRLRQQAPPAARRGFAARNLRLIAGAAALALLFLWGDRMHALADVRAHSRGQEVGVWSR